MTDSRRVKPIMVRMPEDLAQRIEKARGQLSREEWIRQVIANHLDGPENISRLVSRVVRTPAGPRVQRSDVARANARATPKRPVK